MNILYDAVVTIEELKEERYGMDMRCRDVMDVSFIDNTRRLIPIGTLITAYTGRYKITAESNSRFFYSDTWIEIKDGCKMPEDMQPVYIADVESNLGKDKDGKVRLMYDTPVAAWYDYMHQCFQTDDLNHMLYPTHWRPRYVPPMPLLLPNAELDDDNARDDSYEYD
jgi:hypothetical protein